MVIAFTPNVYHIAEGFYDVGVRKGEIVFMGATTFIDDITMKDESSEIYEKRKEILAG